MITRIFVEFLTEYFGSNSLPLHFNVNEFLFSQFDRDYFHAIFTENLWLFQSYMHIWFNMVHFAKFFLYFLIHDLTSFYAYFMQRSGFYMRHFFFFRFILVFGVDQKHFKLDFVWSYF